MADYTQANRRFRVVTGMGPEALLLTGFRGTEGISQLFRFELDLIAPDDAPADFKTLLGKTAVIELDLPNGGVRYFHGIVNRFSQGGKDTRFIHYRAEVVPLFWLLTRREQSRIFQQMTAKEILTKVLDGVPLKWDVKETLAERDYCTQYRESDFDFASRLMEEEGIYYYFVHTADEHTLVLSDHPQGHIPVPEETELAYEQTAGGAGTRQEFLVTAWEKVQEMRSGRVTLWDHNFELPHKPLDAEGKIQDTVMVGTVDHSLTVGQTAELERYDYPGGYADWFDGVTPGGGDRAADLQHIFEQNQRQARLRIQEEAATAVRINGMSICGNLTPGHTFDLTGHFDADGGYIVTTVAHVGSASGDYQSGGGEYRYDNHFTCIPEGLVYRPRRATARPAVKGSQTAVVVGPAGDEIFTDKYGRVKVQFHWDREGQHNAESSCWIRVATIWAGQGWGVIHIPRIGHEVVVDFLEGDPDKPIILGSVYNAEHVPPGSLPKEGMVSGLVSRSTPKGGGSNFNGMQANDTKGKEHLTVQAEYDRTTLVKHDDNETVNNNRSITVKGTHNETIIKDTAIAITTGNYSHNVQTGTATIHVTGAVAEAFDATQSTTVAADIVTTSKGGPITLQRLAGTFTVFGEQQVGVQSNSADIIVQAATKIKLVTGSSSLVMEADGTITLSGVKVKVVGSSESALGCGNQTVTCDPAKVGVAGAEINATAKAAHTVAGAVVKLN